MSADKTRRVLMLGGLMDQKWHTHQGGYVIRIPKPVKFSFIVETERQSEVPSPLIEYEEYHLEHVALYGEGVWVGLHKKTLFDLEENAVGGPDAHVRMILKAILQRDVATELGL